MTLTKYSQKSLNVDKLVAQYRDIVLKANKKKNLLARGDVENLLSRLIEESLLALEWSACEIRTPIVDIGSGAGIPGIPLKLHRPELCTTLLDSNRRKTLVLRGLIEMLRLEDIAVVCERAENFAIDPHYMGHYNTIVSRATAKLQDLLKWGSTLLKPGGELIVWKGSGVDAELNSLGEIEGWSEPAFLRQESGLTLVRFGRG